jgi:hypothetical protein
VRSRPSLVFLLIPLVPGLAAQEAPVEVVVRWDQVVRISKTTPTLQVVVNPPLRRGTPVHDHAFASLRDLGADYVRYVPWLPYPRLGVAELEPPRDGKTFWDFSLIDPMTVDFLEATKGHSAVVNFSILPQWMFKTAKPVAYPENPDQVTWDYQQGIEAVDGTFTQAADYYARILAWYTQGGFTDERGKRHESPFHYTIPYWEVLNEVDSEHKMTPETYTRAYDAIVAALSKVRPGMKFVGAALAAPGANPDFFEYFLNPRNHRKGVPLDYVSYHFYAVPAPDETPEVQQHTVFAQADGFLATVRYIESIRKRLSPQTGTMINEIGIISADDSTQGEPGHVSKPIPGSYWNLAAAEYAYVFGHLAELGIEVAGESQLVGYPTQYPSVSMVDPADGTPNARLRALELLKKNFAPGDRLVEVDTRRGESYVYALAAATASGKRRVLLVNKRDRAVEVSLPGGAGALTETVDVKTGSAPPASAGMASDRLRLGAFSVTVATLP